MENDVEFSHVDRCGRMGSCFVCVDTVVVCSISRDQLQRMHPPRILFICLVVRATSAFLGPDLCGRLPSNPTTTRKQRLLAPILLRAKKMDDNNGAEATEDNDGRQKKQLVASLGVFFVAALIDFFVTHHGVGPWSPDYKL